jgi:hypothetical protein
VRPTQRAAALCMGVALAAPMLGVGLGARSRPVAVPTTVPHVAVVSSDPTDTSTREMAAQRASRSRAIPTPKASPSHPAIRISRPPSRTPAPRSTPTIRHQSHSGYPINIAIADCESGDRLANGRARHYSYDIHQDNVSGSTASGKYQFVNGTWHSVTGLSGRAADYPEETQDAAFWKLWAGGAGAHNWNASRGCWG